MLQKRHLCILAMIGLGMAFPGAQACRYSVRDVGFVDLESTPYRLFSFVNDQTPHEMVAELEITTEAAFFNSNVRPEVVNIDADPGEAAMSLFDRWELGKPEAGRLPASVLVSPEGHSLPIALTQDGEPFKETLWTAVDSILTSPVRAEISKRIVRSYAFVCLIAGTSESLNARSESVVREAIDDLEKEMAFLPKQVEGPPLLKKIGTDDFSSERVFLWSLGLPEIPPAVPSVAILYGRGRRMGPVLRGLEITKEAVFSGLHVIGQSCECGLDRKWMQGTRIPMEWGDDLQAEVVRTLGFDAENPLVKTEISQILNQGRSSSSLLSDSGLEGFEDVILGYTERPVDPQTGITDFDRPTTLDVETFDGPTVPLDEDRDDDFYAETQKALGAVAPLAGAGSVAEPTGPAVGEAASLSGPSSSSASADIQGFAALAGERRISIILVLIFVVVVLLTGFFILIRGKQSAI